MEHHDVELGDEVATEDDVSVESDNDGVAAAAAMEPEDTLLNSFRRKRREIGENTTVTMDVPGYDGELAVKYRRDPDLWDRMKNSAQKLEKSKNPRKELLAMCDTLIAMCDGIYIRHQGTLIALNSALKQRGVSGFDDLDEPIRYDPRLARFLAVEANSAREVVLKTFNNDMALTSHYAELGDWTASSRTEDTQDF